MTDYKAALSYPGPKFYPIIGSLLQIIFLNSGEFFIIVNQRRVQVISAIIEQTFQYARKLAQEFQQSYRQYVIGHVILNAIRAKDVEVSIGIQCFMNPHQNSTFSEITGQLKALK